MEKYGKPDVLTATNPLAGLFATHNILSSITLDAMVEEIKKIYEVHPESFETRWRCYEKLARKNILKLQ